MKAITIKQPFASLIAAGLKEYGFKLENIVKTEPIPAKGKLSIWEFDM